MKTSAIYKIQSIIKPERTYIGSAVNICRRWNEHLRKLRLNIHPNNKLQNHYNKYGQSDLIFTILLGCDKYDLIKTEQYFIDSYKPWFNICPVAGSSMGRVTPEEVKEKIRQKRKFQVNTNKGKKYKWNHPRTGVVWNKGTKGLVVKCNKKPISQYDKTGKYLRDFDSMHDANNITGILFQNIWKCIRGKRKTAGGFIWKLKEAS